MNHLQIRPYQPSEDTHQVFDIWDTTLDTRWPLSTDTFNAMTIGTDTYEPDDHYVATVDGTVVAFVATQPNRDLEPGRG